MQRSEAQPFHQNNFDFLRLLFASLVIITHAVVLSGEGELDLLARLTHGQLSFSFLGVRGFFAISGFLVFQSLQRSSGLPRYGLKRLARIVPGLLAVLLISALVAGPALSVLPAKDYFANAGVMHYILSALRVFPVSAMPCLPGVFTKNPYTCAVNGSLWTVWFELIFYILLAALWLVRREQRLLKIILPCAFLLCVVTNGFLREQLAAIRLPIIHLSLGLATDLAAYFSGGAALTMFIPKNMRYRAAWIAALVASAVALLSLEWFTPVAPCLITLLVIIAGTGYIPALAAVRRLGEPSYGIYIYAYPVQQAIVQLLHPDSTTLGMISWPVSLALGLASWHLIEAPALRWMKPKSPR